MSKIFLVIILGAVLVGAVVFSYQYKFGPMAKSPAASVPLANGKNLDALEKYCMEEALKLPRPQFTYKKVDGPTRSGPMPWINKYMPKELKESEKIGCTLAYRFDGDAAYNSVGLEYPGEGLKFNPIVYERFTASMKTSWELVKGEQNIYKRENSQMKTVDYVDIFNGGLVMYVKFNTHYR